MIKGRGTTLNPPNRFHAINLEPNFFHEEKGLEERNVKTEYIKTHPKTILNKVESPDIPFSYSLNPYQGCEHGCIYCYARPTHNFWGYSSGLDFEQKILIKENAVELLKKKIQSKNWKAIPIAISGNTDPYQPAESKYRLTRSILELLYNHRHPVMIITKNKLILRDLDILKKMNEHNLVSVAVSMTTLNTGLQRILEPRTSIPAQRINIIKELAEHKIPVMAMMAPIIPGLTDHEILNIAKACAEAGSVGLGYSLIRLNNDLDKLFIEWLDHHLPDKKDKVINHIKNMRKGKLSATIKENRMGGYGNIAKIIKDQIILARKLYFPEIKKLFLNTTLHEKYKTEQLQLF